MGAAVKFILSLQTQLLTQIRPLGHPRVMGPQRARFWRVGAEGFEPLPLRFGPTANGHFCISPVASS